VSKANKRERQRQNREQAKIERERLIRRDRRLRALRGLLIVLVPVAIIFVIVAVVQGGDDEGGDDNRAAATSCRDVPDDRKPPKKDTEQQAPAQTIDLAKTYTATIKTSCGTITAKLDAATAPVATNNFVSLSRAGFYDGTCIDRVAEKFVIQGGSPKCDQQSGPGYTVTGEVPTDNYPVGSLAAAKAGDEPAGTMGSQFFIVTGPNGASLPNDYARFGSVTNGLKVARDIESLAPEPQQGAQSGDGPPTRNVVIDKITITES
jgi:cyclophilin family peptidyl-prolyl cis-trans isomerase